jgi:hypothetical protein
MLLARHVSRITAQCRPAARVSAETFTPVRDRSLGVNLEKIDLGVLMPKNPADRPAS